MDHRRMDCGRGKGLGGSSLINGMCYIRGNAMDYDSWAQTPGLRDWSYWDCLPYFKKAESRDVGGDAYHGADGPLSVTTAKIGANELFQALIEAGVEVGHTRVDDLNGYRREGFGPMDRTVTPKGRRASTARGYLDRARDRSNLTIAIRATVDRVRFSGRQAVGVSWMRDGNPREARARREIVLCSGAIASPPLLLRSGIGSERFLRSLDIPVVDLPGVGRNLQDHLEVYIQYACKKPVSLVPSLRTSSKPGIGAEWLLFGSGVGASNHFEGGGFVRSEAGVAWPDLQYHFLPSAVSYNGTNPIVKQSFQMHVGPMRSQSRGRVQITSKYPRDASSIAINYMSQEQDWREFRAGIRITRETVRQEALALFIQPGAGVWSSLARDATDRC